MYRDTSFARGTLFPARFTGHGSVGTTRFSSGISHHGTVFDHPRLSLSCSCFPRADPRGLGFGGGFFPFAFGGDGAGAFRGDERVATTMRAPSE
jgi:hypothetical protein